MVHRKLIATAVLALLPWTTPHARAQAGDCSVVGQNGFVRDVLHDIYLWSDQLRDADPAAFESPEAYLEAVRQQPLDASFSYIGSKAAQDAFFSDSEFIGYGFSSRPIGFDQVRITQVFPRSPAAEAGLARGDSLLEVDGQPVDDLLASGAFFSSFGPSEVGLTVDIAWRTVAGEERRATMIKAVVKIPTVSQVEVLESEDRRVGYIHFRNFVRPSPPLLDAAFESLMRSGVSDLVLDLRYNGGGLVQVAQHLGALIGGELTEAHVMTRLVHNAANEHRNLDYPFPAPPPAALGLPRIAIITTKASASASELLVTGLRPFIPVALIGDTTFGKPVGQYSFEFCEKVLVPVSFRFLNSLGEGDFFGGIPADCAAADDLDHPLGDSDEASLAEALTWLETGACSAAEEAARTTMAGRLRPSAAAYGWQQLLNAH